MSKLMLGYDLRAALHHSLLQQKNLLCHEQKVELLPAIEKITQFNLELEEWYSDKFHLNDRCDYFIHAAEKIEKDVDDISEKIFKPVPFFGLARMFRRIKERRETLAKDKSYPNQLRTQYNNFRLVLLEQYAGARLLEHKGDMGHELERILVQYLERRFNRSVRILFGGHIYDYNGNSSIHQTDIIVTPANALPFCPGDTSDGKYNVMADQVLAVISVTSRLSATTFREKYQELQKLKQLNTSTQPLCYIIGAECSDLEGLQKAWEELESPDYGNLLRMTLLLDSGFIRLTPTIVPAKGERFCQLHSGIDSERGLCAGLGLGWLEAEIAGRNCLFTNQPSDWVDKLRKQLFNLEAINAVSITDDWTRYHAPTPNIPIHGMLIWGCEPNSLHNRLRLSSIYVNGETLLDKQKSPSDSLLAARYGCEPRWFKIKTQATNGNYCALEEWIEQDCEKPRRQIAVFDSRTGEEVTEKLSRTLDECSELEQLNPVLKEG